jgi:hypothetical protein
MNNKTAKKLKRLAIKLLAAEGISGGDGYNEYNQIENRILWEPAYQDGKPHNWDNPEENEKRVRAADPDGNALLAMRKVPGTVFTAWRLRMAYNNLKRLWKETGGKHELFTELEKLDL